MEPTLNIRAAISGDVPSMLALERGCPTAAHWTEHHYENLFAAPADGVESLVLIVEMADPTTPPGEAPVLGFLVARHVASDWELENIVVAPTARRKGVGRRLLEALLDRVAQTNGSVFLEVRESNIAARKLYEKAGFCETGRRKSYYINPAEDGVVYRYTLANPFSS